ncbi:MAG TPA: hypothetical protein HA282_02640 [Nanoarchaeota archaeon]|nr:hypothetical protein [Nanoarchaeota archaeon]HIH34208.1 hypothetical protein [Nanoarchaeota archaeon]HIH51416.1 hypothetical protein [Nanoarchaeota archaeon]HIH66090.1 hypothetical protein [Nanoarchaeota archaeon]
MGLEDSSDSGYETSTALEGVVSRRPSRREMRIMTDEQILGYIWDKYGRDVTPSRLRKVDVIIYQRMVNRGLTSQLNSGTHYGHKAA